MKMLKDLKVGDTFFLLDTVGKWHRYTITSDKGPSEGNYWNLNIFLSLFGNISSEISLVIGCIFSTTQDIEFIKRKLAGSDEDVSSVLNAIYKYENSFKKDE